MEPPTKKQNSGDDDRFSDLPGEVVHHILDFLGTRDFERLSFVSKRCRELCISNPNLCLSNMDDKSGGSSFNRFVDRFMARRCADRVKTGSFLLRWSFDDEDDEERRVERWLKKAAIKLGGVAEISLKFIRPQPQPRRPKPKPFAHFVFCFVIPKVPRGRCREWLSQITPARSDFATELESLQLRHVRIENDCNLGELLSSFKSLKVLKLDRISRIKGMTITSSSIEILSIVSVDNHLCDVEIQQLHKLYDLNLFWNPKSSRSLSLKISAPNLQTFKWNLLRALIGLHLPGESSFYRE
ncbi:uncharacterized protein LOC132172190 isoform X2 [Corylus avellana]|uniref:uncharacterized protein LOC132172190 isoform X2 n=1 Tax=Corylus avellana TaxID=13451 RepID=UPI00286D2C48|nr:uncharacterized protein LOC132172190 isoform X2 [Corylus avellana]